MKSIWGRPSHLPKIHVEYNDKGVPIDGECSTLSHFLGSIARNCQYCPISVMDWRKISKKNKTEILDIVKVKASLCYFITLFSLIFYFDFLSIENFHLV